MPLKPKKDQEKEDSEISQHLKLEELWAADDNGKDKLVEILPSDAVQAIEFEINAVLQGSRVMKKVKEKESA